jgi:enoyl-CoA hydratase/carnithine racemase
MKFISKEKMDGHPLIITKHSPAFWRVTFDNPPVNLLDAPLVNGVRKLYDQMEADKDVRVVVFDSANEDFFICHFDVVTGAEVKNTKGDSGFSAWIDVMLRMYSSPVISIASSRGRARGNGSEFLLACDMVFASKEKAVFNQVEVGVGVLPGGGGIEHLAACVTRSRAIEIIIGSEDFNADIAERYGWINRAIPDAELDDFVNALAKRISAFDKEVIAEAKALINHRTGGGPSGFLMEGSFDAFWNTTKRPETKAKFDKLFAWGLQQHSDMELNFGKYIERLDNN